MNFISGRGGMEREFEREKGKKNRLESEVSSWVVTEKGLMRKQKIEGKKRKLIGAFLIFKCRNNE